MPMQQPLSNEGTIKIGHGDEDLSGIRLLSLGDILGDKNSGAIGVLPISQSAWFLGVRTGIYPKPVKVGRRSFWRASDIRELLTKIRDGAPR